jgi:hypothetical protein
MNRRFAIRLQRDVVVTTTMLKTMWLVVDFMAS